MRHSRLFLFLAWLLVAIITGAFWGLTQLVPDATHAVLNQTLQTVGMSDVSLVYTIIELAFVVSLVIIAVMLAIFLADRWKKPVEKYPEVMVECAEDDTKRFTRFEVQLRDRREPIEARFAFLTVTNLTGPAVSGIEADFHVSNVVSRKAVHEHGPLVFVFSTHSDHLTIHREEMSIDEYRSLHGIAEHFEAEVANTDDDKLASRTITLNQGQSKTVGLVLTLKDSDWVFIPNYQTRSWVVMPCSFDIELTFFGNPAVSPKPVRFHVHAKDWKSLHVIKFGSSLKRQQERMRLVYAPLHSAVASMRVDELDPRREFTAGTPHNPWNDHPEIMEKVIEVFTSYPDLVEDERVSKGWKDNESELRKHDFRLGGKTLYDWFDAIEEEYHVIDSELRSRLFSS